MKAFYLFKPLVFAVAFIVISGKTAADEPYRSFEDREQQATLIVKAKVVSLVPLKFSQDMHERKVAILAIQNIIKGNFGSEFILVSVGYYWPGGVVSSQDIAIEVGISGTWLLSKDETGLFKLNSPSDVIINKLN